MVIKKRVFKKRVFKKRIFKRNYKRRFIYNKPELKLKQTQVLNEVGTAVAAPTLILLNGLVKGTDYINRLGRVVSSKSLDIALLFSNTSVTVAKGRCTILIDREPAQTTALIGDIYDTSVLSYVYGCQRNLDYRSRFKVLKDFTFNLSSTDSDDSNNKRIIKYYKKLYSKTQYDDSDVGDITDIRKNAIYLIWSTTAGASGTLTYSIRYRFIDT